MIQYVDREGVLLAVEYHLDSPDGLPTILNIRATDTQYRRVGPDLAPLLHTLFCKEGDIHHRLLMPVAVPVLDGIAKEIIRGRP
ncbi:MAG: hypothetical protein E6R04_09780 [Spirochaetes bacterium]|nr:MAG: hypothetical protein E6R04_09780 [Spirochaetota bacterium]